MWTVVIISALIAISSIAVTYALRPTAPEPPKPSLQDLGAPTAEPGRPIPKVFGTVVLKSPNVVWYGDVSYKPVKS
jgi:hypothetical protein